MPVKEEAPQMGDDDDDDDPENRYHEHFATCGGGRCAKFSPFVIVTAAFFFPS